MRWVPRDYANHVVATWHSHLPPVTGSIFQLGAFAGDLCVGVVIVGRPEGRGHDDGLHANVTRLATNGHPNAGSRLLGQARRAMQAMGFATPTRSYTLLSEDGTPYQAAGWQKVAVLPPRAWKRSEGTKRANLLADQAKFRWERAL